MKIALSRQTLYMLVLSLLLLVLVLLFAFGLLIPTGKAYRAGHIAMKKELAVLQQYEQWHDETYAQLQQLRSNNKHIIMAFDNTFDPAHFVAAHKERFESLQLSPLQSVDTNKSTYAVFEVNATSKIDSPQTFYDFLDQVNKSDWIVSVQFPIRFEREGNLIRSSFCMQVYSLGRNEHNVSKASGAS